MKRVKKFYTAMVVMVMVIIGEIMPTLPAFGASFGPPLPPFNHREKGRQKKQDYSDRSKIIQQDINEDGIVDTISVILTRKGRDAYDFVIVLESSKTDKTFEKKILIIFKNRRDIYIRKSIDFDSKKVVIVSIDKLIPGPFLDIDVARILFQKDGYKITIFNTFFWNKDEKEFLKNESCMN